MNQRKIDSLSSETEHLIAQLNNPNIEKQMEALGKLDEISKKIQHLIELESKKRTTNIDSKLNRINNELNFFFECENKTL